jgi:two-component system phosphate regulon sensor histidine kinase PhoR
MRWQGLNALETGVGLVAVVVVALVARRRASALAELAQGVCALEEGRPVRPIQARVGGALGRLARRFNAVAPRLEGRIARLEEDRQQLQAVLSGMTEGVIAVDARRRLLFANPSAERLFGLGSGAVGRLVPELIRGPQVQDAVEATLAGSGPHQLEVTLPDREVPPRSGARILAVQGTPLPGSPPPGAVLVFHDVTELRRLERLRQDFVANASHELKTPLASIKAYTETLLEWAVHDDEVNVRFLRQIDEQANRLDRLILDMLSLARLESGQEVYRHRPLTLTSVIRACVEPHRDRAETKGLTLALDLEALDETAQVRADEEAVRQIVDNLIDNALKYTPEGGNIRVSGRSEDRTIVLEVADTGVGIPRDDLPRVFERFYRVDRARSRALGGTGLGLSIVKHLVQSLGGQVAVSSRVGSGSTFTVRLPRVRPDR